VPVEVGGVEEARGGLGRDPLASLEIALVERPSTSAASMADRSRKEESEGSGALSAAAERSLAKSSR
jgi:hypothetical protein